MGRYQVRMGRYQYAIDQSWSQELIAEFGHSNLHLKRLHYHRAVWMYSKWAQRKQSYVGH